MALFDVEIQDDFDYHKNGKPIQVRYDKKIWLFDRRFNIRLYRRSYNADNTFEQIKHGGFQNKK